MLNVEDFIKLKYPLYIRIEHLVSIEKEHPTKITEKLFNISRNHYNIIRGSPSSIERRFNADWDNLETPGLKKLSVALPN